MSWVEDVNHYWFQEIHPDDWFSGRPEIDEEIKSRFGSLREELKQHPPAPKDLTVEGHVAAVIVFDQFSRNIFRNSPEAYATDPVALALACHAVDLGFDAALGARQRQFLYMPFMHSENPEMQARCVTLFRGIGIEDLNGYAEHHRRIVDRFGRFPHRNAVLGRATTEEEAEFLAREPWGGA